MFDSVNYKKITFEFLERPTSIYIYLKNVNTKMLNDKLLDNFLDKNKSLFHDDFINIFKNIDSKNISTEKINNFTNLIELFINDIKTTGNLNLTYLNLLCDYSVGILNSINTSKNNTKSNNSITNPIINSTTNPILVGGVKLNKTNTDKCKNNNYDDTNDCWLDPISYDCIDDNYVITGDYDRCYDAKVLAGWFSSEIRAGKNIKWPMTHENVSFSELETINNIAKYGKKQSYLVKLNNKLSNQIRRFIRYLPDLEDLFRFIFVIFIISMILYGIMKNSREIGGILLKLLCYLLIAICIIIISSIKTVFETPIYELEYDELVRSNRNVHSISKEFENTCG